MKKLICVLLAFLLLTLSGCSHSVEVLSNDQYSIMEKDGQHYMKLHKPVSPSSGNTLEGTAQAPYIIEFSSLAELKNTITKGTFTEKQLAHMQEHFPQNKSGNILLCNVNKLYAATVPNDIEIGPIHWYGDSYSFMLNEEGRLNFCSKEAYDEFASAMEVNAEAVPIIDVATASDRNAKVVEFKNLLGEPRKRITYSLTTDTKTITIAEDYHLDESETVPHRIKFCGTVNGVYFTGYMYGFTERPSYEWVTSFGLKPYVETETE